MEFDLGHTISSLSKLAAITNKNKTKNLEEIEFFNWLDGVLSKNFQQYKAINFNLCEDSDNK